MFLDSIMTNKAGTVNIYNNEILDQLKISAYERM